MEIMKSVSVHRKDDMEEKTKLYIPDVTGLHNWTFVRGDIIDMKDRLESNEAADHPIYMHITGNYHDTGSDEGLNYNIHDMTIMNGKDDLQAWINCVYPNGKLCISALRRNLKHLFWYMGNNEITTNILIVQLSVHVRNKNRTEVYNTLDEILMDFGMDDLPVYIFY